MSHEKLLLGQIFTSLELICTFCAKVYFWLVCCLCHSCKNYQDHQTLSIIVRFTVNFHRAIKILIQMLSLNLIVDVAWRGSNIINNVWTMQLYICCKIKFDQNKAHQPKCDKTVYTNCWSCKLNKLIIYHQTRYLIPQACPCCWYVFNANINTPCKKQRLSKFVWYIWM